MKRPVIAIAAAFLAAGLAFAEPAPEFSLKSIDGKTVALAGQKGKIVFLDFWASWCPPCRRSIPAVEKLAEDYAGQPVAVLGINLENLNKARAFAAEKGLKYTVLVDDGRTADRYGVRGIPAFFIIDGRGEIVKRYSGYAPGMEEEWRATIEALLPHGPRKRK